MDGERAGRRRARGMLALPVRARCSRSSGRRGDLLVPLVRDAVRAVDVAARRIDVDLAFLAG